MAELVVRVKWTGGRVDVSDGGSGRRRTIAFDAGADVTTRAAAVAVGQAQLQILGPQDTVEATIGDTPFWPGLGDAVRTEGFSGPATHRLDSRRVSTDRNGHAALRLTLGTRAQVLAERQKVGLERLAAGGTGGRSGGVSPASIGSGLPSGALRPVSILPWVASGVMVDDGPLWKAPIATIATKIELLATVAPPSDDITVAVYVDGVQETFVLLPQGSTSFSRLGSLLIMPGQQLQCRVTNIGANTEAQLEDAKLTIQFTAAPGELRVQERRAA